MTQINFILFLFNSSYGHKKTEDNVYFSIFKLNNPLKFYVLFII